MERPIKYVNTLYDNVYFNIKHYFMTVLMPLTRVTYHRGGRFMFLDAIGGKRENVPNRRREYLDIGLGSEWCVSGTCVICHDMLRLQTFREKA